MQLNESSILNRSDRDNSDGDDDVIMVSLKALDCEGEIIWRWRTLSDGAEKVMHLNC